MIWGERGSAPSLDLYGGKRESVEAEAIAARDQYLRDAGPDGRPRGVEVNVSVKLTQMGFDIGEDLCHANMTRILDKARQLRGFVRLDMEGSDYTQRTLDFFVHRLFPEPTGPTAASSFSPHSAVPSRTSRS